MRMYKDYSDQRPPEREILADKVYVNSNIKAVGVPADDVQEAITQYEFDCTEYTKDEYIAALDEQLTDTQLALAEIYEGMV